MQAPHDGIKPGLAASERLPSVDPHCLAPLATAGAAHAWIDRLLETATPADEAGGDEGNTKADSMDSAARNAVEQADKAFATLRAHLALAGFELHIIGDGAGGAQFQVHRWALSKVLPDVQAVEAFARSVGASL